MNNKYDEEMTAVDVMYNMLAGQELETTRNSYSSDMLCVFHAVEIAPPQGYC